MKWRPSLRSILLMINVVVMLLPLGGIAWLRLYESALVRQTESELLAQGAVVAAAYKAALQNPTWTRQGQVLAQTAPIPDIATAWQARVPRLDLATDPVMPRPAEAAATTLKPDPHVAAVGQQFSAVLREVRQSTLAGVRVVDHQGIVVASTAGDFGGQLQQEEIEAALLGETISRLRERHSDSAQQGQTSLSRAAGIRVFVAVPVIDQQHVVGAVLLTRTPASLWNTIQGKRTQLAYAALALLALVVALSWLTTRTLARPIAELRDQALRAARGEVGALQPLRHAGTREVAELADTLIAMARTLESRADYIRRFAAQVSHEFKTPLTSIRGAVELLREHSDELEPAERSRFQNIIASDVGRLDRLVRRLLELARADVATVGDVYTDALAVLRGCITRYRETGCSIDLDAPESAAIVRMSDDELESVFGNLLANAREHAPNKHVHVSATQTAGELHIRFEDAGPGISPANAERVFEPFFTTRRSAGSTGLGLSIVRALLSAHDGRIELVASVVGTAFLIHLPLSPDSSQSSGHHRLTTSS